MSTFRCRFCETPLSHTFADLGMSPLANSYVKPENAHKMEPFYPLHAYVCENCLLVQLGEFESPEHIFGDYAYFSSFSDSWLAHCKDYTYKMTERFGLNAQSKVVEIASNDGYLLQYFIEQGVPVLGVEPAANVAKVAEEKGVPTRVRFFGTETANQMKAEGIQADLLLGNNVLAHVPNLRDFVAGMKTALKPQGVITMEFPHLLQLMRFKQFDTIYHEHFSYFSFYTVEKVFAEFGITLFDVEELPTHGGSLRIYGRHTENTALAVEPAVEALRRKERQAGLDRLETYSDFSRQIQEVKRRLVRFLLDAQEQGKTVVGYGAPAKGNTLLNYCGIKTDLLAYTVDRSPYKQNCLLPGTRIPIYGLEKIRETQPDYVLILPWNIREEIMKSMDFIREWGGEFVLSIPQEDLAAV